MKVKAKKPEVKSSGFLAFTGQDEV